MLNKEFQERILIKWGKGSTIDYNFSKSNSCREKYKESTNYSLQKFVEENKECVILSKACKKIKGLDYKAVYFALKEFKIKCRTHPFSDEDYLPAIGDIRAILISVPDCKKLLAYFGLTKKEIGQAIYSSIFDYNDYNNYLIKRHKTFIKEKIESDAFFNEIRLPNVIYNKKEYVSEHKYPSDIIKSYVEKNKSNPTDGEKAMLDILTQRGVDFEFQKPCVVNGNCYIMDFYLPEYGVCIEVDGGYHNTQEQLAKDMERANNLAKTGILVVRFTNDEVINESFVNLFLANVLNIK